AVADNPVAAGRLPELDEVFANARRLNQRFAALARGVVYLQNRVAFRVAIELARRLDLELERSGRVRAADREERVLLAADGPRRGSDVPRRPRHDARQRVLAARSAVARAVGDLDARGGDEI